MGIFDKMKEPVFLKESGKAEVQLTKLRKQIMNLKMQRVQILSYYNGQNLT